MSKLKWVTLYGNLSIQYFETFLGENSRFPRNGENLNSLLIKIG